MILAIICGSCEDTSEEFMEEQAQTRHEFLDVPIDGIMGVPIDCNVFDWENNNQIYYDSQSRYVNLPWISGTSGIDPVLANDHKKADGWELVYNSFDRASWSYPYLIFYNKYRGVLRVYYYHVTQLSASDLFFGLVLKGDTALLNMNDDFPLPMNVTTRDGNLVVVNLTELGTGGPSPNNWYTFDFGLTAYDSSIIGQSSLDNYLKGYIWAQQNSTVSVSGTQTGSLSGQMQIKGSSLVDNFALTLGSSSMVQIGNTKSQGKESLLKTAGKQVRSGLESAIKKASEDLAGDLLDFATDPISSLFTGLIGTKSSSKSTINLTMDTEIELSGTISSNQAILPNGNNEFIPGTTYDQSGYAPCTDYSFGVWNLSNVPQVNAQINESCTDITHNYSLNSSSFNVVINPDISNDLQNTSLETSLVYMANFKSPNNMWLNPINDLISPNLNSSNVINSDPSNTWFEGNQYVFERYSTQYTPVDLYVKVKLVLYPYGSEPVTHVRYFKPTISYSYNFTGVWCDETGDEW